MLIAAIKSFFRLQFVENHAAEVLNRDAHLFHRVAIAHGDGVVFQGLVVDGHAHWRAESCLLHQKNFGL